MAVPVKGTLLGLITAFGGMIFWTHKHRLLKLFHRGQKEKTLSVGEAKTATP
jgi:hypothetical protein